MKRNTLALLVGSWLLALLVGCGGDSHEKHMASARAYLLKNDRKSAIVELKNALRASADRGEARFLLGSALLKEEDPVAAELELRKALALKYAEDLVVPELAGALLMQGQAKKLVDEFGNTRFDKPAGNAKLQTALASAYGLLNQQQQQRAAIERALNADPSYVPALVASAAHRAVARDLDGAMSTLESVFAREPGNPDALKLKGDLLLRMQRKPEDALSAYRQALQSQPGFVPAHAGILTVLIQQGKYDEAGKQLDQLKIAAPNNPQTKLFEARLAYQKRDFKLARELAQQLLRVAPDSPLILQMAGAVELELNSLIQAEIYFRKAIQAEPQLTLARRLLVVTYLRSGEPAKAIAALNAMADKQGLDPALYSLAGEAHLQNGDAKKAEEYFAKALKLDPHDARKRTALALSHFRTNQSSAAIDELRDISESDSGITADLALISAHLARKEFDKALAAIARLEVKQPEKPLAANLRGRVHLARSDNVAARQSFEKALVIDPSFFAATASLAAIDVTDNKPAEARKRFEDLLKRNPKHPEALLALAKLVAMQGGTYAEVTSLLAKAIEATPTEVAPRLMLIDLHLRNRNHKQAIDLAQNAVAALPGSPELLEALGRAQQAGGELLLAMATFGKLAAAQPLSPHVHLRLAEVQSATKDNAGAERSLRKALEIKPDLLDAQRPLILLAMSTNRMADATRIARAVQEQRPKEAVGYLLEGDVAIAQKRMDVAASLYRKGLQLAPSGEVASRLHTILLLNGQAAEAERLTIAWLKEHPKDVQFIAYLGDLAIARKDLVSAERFYQTVVQLRPTNALALNNLAWLTGQLRKEGAVAYAEKANSLVPHQPAFMDTLAMLLADRKEYGRAADLLKEALKLQPANASLRLNLAKVYIEAGDKTRARGELTTLATLGEKFAAQAEVAALLKRL